MKHQIGLGLTLFICSLFLGCASDLEKELSNDYVFSQEDDIHNWITKRVSTQSSGMTIPSVIVKYGFNDDFIIAEQKEADSEDCMRLREGPVNNFSELYESCREYVFEENKKNQYWIIDHSSDSIYGSMSEGQFWNKRIELKVPDELSWSWSL